MFAATQNIGFMACAVPGSGDGCADPLTDSYWGNVELLCWCNGADNGTTFTDETGNYLTLSNPSNHVTTQSSNKKFGSASAEFPGEVAQALIAGVVGDFDFLSDGTTDYTAEMWFRTSSDKVVLFATCSGASNERGVFFHVITTVGLGLHIYNGTGVANIVLETSHNVSDGNWHHIVFQYDSSETDKYQIFVDGALIVAGNGTGIYQAASHSYELHMGRAPTNVNYSKVCSMDDIRITKGIARYPASGFTPPCRQLPDS